MTEEIRQKEHFKRAKAKGKRAKAKEEIKRVKCQKVAKSKGLRELRSSGAKELGYSH